MARVVGFVFLRKQKVSGVQTKRYVISHTVRLTERRANEHNGSNENGLRFCNPFSLRLKSEVRVWLG